MTFINTIYRKERLNYARFELKKRVLDSIINTKKIKPAIRWYTQTQFDKKFKRTSKVSFKNRCQISGRSRSFYGFAKMSRLFLKDNAFIGKVPGLQKDYW